MVYLARRHLNLSPQQWDDLPWHEAKMYIDGFKEDGILQGGKGSNGQPGASAGPPRMDLTSGNAPANFRRRVVTAG